MLLYTIQEAEYFKKYQIDNSILDGSVLEFEDFKPKYQWLIKQLNSKNKSFKKNKYPIWAWKDRPDLREYRSHYSKSKKYVLVTLDVPESEIIFSGLNFWHFVLNGSFLSTNCKEDEAFDKKYNVQYYNYWLGQIEVKEEHKTVTKKMSKEMKTEIENSWQKIFDLNFLQKHKDYLQANIPSIKPEYIKKIVEYQGSGKD